MSKVTINSGLVRADKRIRVALPLRITYADGKDKPSYIMACTYDISGRGAKVSALGDDLKVGDIIAVERGRNKVFCRVVWVGSAGSPRQGQVGIETVDPGRPLWKNELVELSQMFDRLPRFGGPPASFRPGGGLRERRHFLRLGVEGSAELLRPDGGRIHTLGSLRDLSHAGCRVMAPHPLVRGTDLRLILNVANYDLGFKGQVRHVLDTEAGIEFHAVRKGDQELLQTVLRMLEEQPLEDPFEDQIEVQPGR